MLYIFGQGQKANTLIRPGSSASAIYMAVMLFTSIIRFGVLQLKLRNTCILYVRPSI